METTTEHSASTEMTAGHRIWRRWLIPLAVIVLFAAGVLQFALIQWHHLPADQRVNDGEQPTFFAFHILPSFNFSEDFHLYYVRAKRIAERGWSDSLLYSRPDEGTNLAAPVQVALSRLAVMTDGRPLAYSLYIFAILAVAWVALFAAARCWMPTRVRTASILVAVLIAVLFESTHYFVTSPEFPTFGQWPMFRGLRMSTMSWTSPLLVAVLLCVTSLVFDQRRCWARIVLLLGMLLLLAGADNWAFGLAWFSTGLVLAWIALAATIQRWRSGGWPVASRLTVAGLTLVVAAGYLLHQQFNGAMHGDMLMRAGFGAEWCDSIRPSGHVMQVRDWFLRQGLFPVCVVLFGSLVALRPAASGRLPLQVQWRRGESFAVQIRFLALLPLIAMLVMYELLKFQGMEPFLRHQLFWRANYCWLFVFVLTTLEWWREVLTAWSAGRGRASTTTPSLSTWRRPWHFCRPKTWASAMALGLAVLLAYHNYRLHQFVTKIAARDFFLTADAEKLRPWLEQFERDHGRFELATASLELNYLAAYWTNADLLLPSGFPYHNAANNREIRDRALQVLKLYGATPQSWNEFTRSLPRRFQEAWRDSRIRASGEAYLYHFYHRMLSFDTLSSPKWRKLERNRIGESLAARMPANIVAPASYSQPLATAPRPDVILIDNVSRALGQPDLSGYDLAFRGGAIEAWVRRDATLTKSAPAAEMAQPSALSNSR